MAHAIWNGSINFGLVTIPVKLFTAVRENDLHFNMLHKKDNGRINFQRICSVDGKKVEWNDIVKGYELDKDEYIVVTDEDLKGVAPEATQSIDITEFVDLADINPILFDKPYYLEPEKKGRHAYALLRDSLAAAGKVGIAKVVIKTRQHLAAVEPRNDTLVLELMHFADELVDSEEFKIPHKTEVGKKEKDMARQLVNSMSSKWEPDKYHDDYRRQLLDLIHQKVRAGGKPLPTQAAKPSRKASNVIDLVAVLQKSIAQSKAGSGKKSSKAVRRSSRKEKAGSRHASA